jgi:UDP-N-acetylmuramate dehydrogenase
MTLTIPSHWAQSVPLSELTTWHIGGPARFLTRPRDARQLRDDLMLARSLALPVFVIGAGSNLLFPDAGYPGLLVRLPGGSPQIEGVPPAASADAVQASIEHRVRVTLPAGAMLSASARLLGAQGWAGLEWAEGIPGTVGGAVVNNAGAYGGDIAKVLEGVDVLTADGAIDAWPAERLELAYRASALKGREPTHRIILAARLLLEGAAVADLERRMAEIRSLRAARTPVGASCGSVFRNPPGEAAGRLIAGLGLAGEQRGDAEIATLHANYILNRGRARAADVLDLIRHVRRRVREERGIALALEVQLVGFPQRVLDEFS